MQDIYLNRETISLQSIEIILCPYSISIFCVKLNAYFDATISILF